MAKPSHENEKQGMSLSTRLTLIMTLALAAVMTVASLVLFKTTAKLTGSVRDNALLSVARLTSANQQVETDLRRLATERDLLVSIEKLYANANSANTELLAMRDEMRKMRGDRTERIGELERTLTWRQVEGEPVLSYDSGQIQRFPIEIGAAKDRAYLFRVRAPVEGKRDFELLAPASIEGAEEGLLRVIIVITVVVIAVGALVSLIVASQIARPIKIIADDVWQISKGDLTHRTRARGVREVTLLARSIDRMTADLSAAQEAQLELSSREREVALAAEVRESLLANATPVREGYEFGALYMSAASFGGDFYDFITTPAGEVGLLVCDVSGRGMPATLVGATARAYLRAALSRGEDLRQALFHVNRELARDVRRGMYVSALYALLDPRTRALRVACAGHKLPLVHFSAATGKVRLVQPEGIALGFDPGPIFESRLELAELVLEAGDRVAIFNSGPAVLADPEGKEFGEKHVYSLVQRHGARKTEDFIERLRSVLESHGADATLARDISILTARKL